MQRKKPTFLVPNGHGDYTNGNLAKSKSPSLTGLEKLEQKRACGGKKIHEEVANGRRSRRKEREHIARVTAKPDNAFQWHKFSENVAAMVKATLEYEQRLKGGSPSSFVTSESGALAAKEETGITIRPSNGTHLPEEEEANVVGEVEFAVPIKGIGQLRNIGLYTSHAKEDDPRVRDDKGPSEDKSTDDGPFKEQQLGDKSSKEKAPSHFPSIPKPQDDTEETCKDAVTVANVQSSPQNSHEIQLGSQNPSATQMQLPKDVPFPKHNITSTRELSKFGNQGLNPAYKTIPKFPLGGESMHIEPSVTTMNTASAANGQHAEKDKSHEELKRTLVGVDSTPKEETTAEEQQKLAIEKCLHFDDTSEGHYLNCDLRYFPMRWLAHTAGPFEVVLVDPPWRLKGMDKLDLAFV